MSFISDEDETRRQYEQERQELLERYSIETEQEEEPPGPETPESPGGNGPESSEEPPADLQEAWPVLAPEAFHGLAGEVVREIEPESEAVLPEFLYQPE